MTARRHEINQIFAILKYPRRKSSQFITLKSNSYIYTLYITWKMTSLKSVKISNVNYLIKFYNSHAILRHRIHVREFIKEPYQICNTINFEKL